MYYKRKYGLTDKNIRLYEERLREGISDRVCGTATKTGENEYDVDINRENIEWWIELGERSVSLENTIRHELNHIRFGDCDKELPPPFNKLYRNLIAEPRAHLAAWFNI